MWDYLRRHERFVREALAGSFGEVAFAELKSFHLEQVYNLQHERFIHLIVTMAVALFTLMAIGGAVTLGHWSVGLLAFVLLGLTVAYLLHYFRLENGVQRLYGLSQEIDLRTVKVSACYDGKGTRVWRRRPG